MSVAEATARTAELAARWGVKLQGAVTWAFEFENQPWFAGYRELATNGVDKAVLNVFREFGMLDGDWLPVTSNGALSLDELLSGAAGSRSDVNAIATRRGKEIDVLAWNYDDRDIAAAPAMVTLKVNGVHSDSLRADRFVVDQDHGNAYATWQALGSPHDPDAAERAQLERSSWLAQVTTVQPRRTEDGNYAVPPFSIARQGVTLVRVRWQ